MVFLMTYSESTHKVTSIWTLLGWYHVFRGCCHQHPVFGEKQDFAFREQQNRFRAKLTTGPENSWSKVPPPKRFLVFFFDIMCATPFLKFFRFRFTRCIWCCPPKLGGHANIFLASRLFGGQTVKSNMAKNQSIFPKKLLQILEKHTNREQHDIWDQTPHAHRQSRQPRNQLSKSQFCLICVVCTIRK